VLCEQRRGPPHHLLPCRRRLRGPLLLGSFRRPVRLIKILNRDQPQIRQCVAVERIRNHEYLLRQALTPPTDNELPKQPRHVKKCVWASDGFNCHRYKS
jgi:hypothetical protein